MTAIILLLVIIIGILWLSSFLTLREYYQFYKPTYDAIVNGSYVRDRNLSSDSTIYFRRPDNTDPFTDNEIIFFGDGKGSIKLLTGKRNISAYIHEASFTFFDPYTLYWRKKIIIAFEESKQKSLNTL
jgi:hypothetical protein